MIKHKRKKVGAAAAQSKVPLLSKSEFPEGDRKIVCRVHSGVWGVDLDTLTEQPNIHAAAVPILSGRWIEEDSRVELVCGPVSLLVCEGDVQNFWEVSFVDSSGKRCEGWVPESFLNLPQGECWC